MSLSFLFQRNFLTIPFWKQAHQQRNVSVALLWGQRQWRRYSWGRNTSALLYFLSQAHQSPCTPTPVLAPAAPLAAPPHLSWPRLKYAQSFLMKWSDLKPIGHTVKSIINISFRYICVLSSLCQHSDGEMHQPQPKLPYTPVQDKPGFLQKETANQDGRYIQSLTEDYVLVPAQFPSKTSEHQEHIGFIRMF